MGKTIVNKCCMLETICLEVNADASSNKLKEHLQIVNSGSLVDNTLLSTNA